MEKINLIARKHKIHVIEDSAQSILSEYNGKKIGNSKNICCFSLHPTKNFGGIMDGGFISTKNTALANKIKIMRNHGLQKRGIVKYAGRNSRLSEINSNALLKKIGYLKKDTLHKIKLAKYYDNYLNKKKIITPVYGSCKKIEHTYHRYVIRVKQRESLIKYLKSNGIETKVHYEKNIHQQKSILKKLKIPFKLNQTDKISRETLSLPINQFLSLNHIKYVTKKINEFYNKKF